MTKIQSITLALLTAISLGTLATGCTKIESKADFGAIITAKAAAEIETKTAELVITPESAGTLDLTWKAADYGKSVPASYTVVLTHGDKSLKYPVTIGQRTLSIPLLELNKRLVTELGLVGGTKGKLDITVESLPMATNGNPKALETYRLTSKPYSLSVIPFFASVKPDIYFLVGDVSGIEGAPVWNPKSTDYALFVDDNNSVTYHYYGYFKKGAEFKIFPADCIGGWDTPVIGVKDGKLHRSGDAANIALPAGSKEGYYHVIFTVNRGKLDPAQCTIAFEPYDAGGKKTFQKLGIIGTAGVDWGTDVFLEQSKGEPHLWIGEEITLKEGEFKLRADSDWGANWGGTKDNTFPSYFGIGNPGGPNWKVTAKETGKYTVYFNDLTGHFYFEKEK